MEDARQAARRELGRHLRRLRQASGWTLEDLVRTVERQGGSLSISTLHRIERGRSALPLQTLSLLSRSLGVPVAELAERLHLRLGQELAASEAPDQAEDSKDLLEAARASAATGDYWKALTLLDAALAELDAAQAGPDVTPAVRDPAHADLDVTHAEYGAARADRIAGPAGLDAAQADPAKTAGPSTAQRRARIHLARSFCLRKLRHYELSLAAAGDALKVDGAGESLTIQALLLHMEVHTMRGDYLRARVYADWCASRLAQLEPPAKAHARLALAILAFKQECHAEALSHLDAAQDLYAGLGRTLEQARVEVLRAACLHRLGRRLAARRLVEQGRARARSVSGWEVVFLAQLYEGQMDRRERAKAAAAERFRSACDVARRARLTNDLFIGWFHLWHLGRDFDDRKLERRAARVLERMLRRVERTALPEAEQFLARRSASRRPERHEDD